ncbi:hypothetical protein T265_07576 [Opisthorchis viverrini]|uniref:UmuC domain-containing protein n=1 Tax=Opisthorchis viverrini TaxID=6198 RepID=A0A074ZND0_OPIVI|nr:hypothetical protein T265_07576 [Opisthorchis viverrini]KER24845.1 hypothetical protein T265_07576 [Opisthorchis viverrini]
MEIPVLRMLRHIQLEYPVDHRMEFRLYHVTPGSYVREGRLHKGSMNRIVLLIDMDCFYVQVEQRSRPETLGKPCAVAQYNGETGVSYEARAEGVKRGMWGKTAISVCPNLILFEVPEKRGKADLAKYRSASAEVFQCISEHFKDVERASIDEAYVDLTELVTSTVQQTDWTKSEAHQPNSESFVVIDSGSVLGASENGMCASLDRLDWVNYLQERFNDGLRYAVATELTHKLRQTILTRTGFRCSAGIAPNKVRHVTGSGDEMAQWLERRFSGRKVRGSNPTSSSRFPLCRLGQPDSIPALCFLWVARQIGTEKVLQLNYSHVQPRCLRLTTPTCHIGRCVVSPAGSLESLHTAAQSKENMSLLALPFLYFHSAFKPGKPFYLAAFNIRTEASRTIGGPYSYTYFLIDVCCLSKSRIHDTSTVIELTDHVPAAKL